jgi:2-oxoglutarate dehydrogenase E1 component
VNSENPYVYTFVSSFNADVQLIIFFSKSLLRHPLAKSGIEDFIGDTTFQRYIPEPHTDALVAPEKIRRHILCSGQVYFQLLKEREDRKIDDVAISRVEQLSPLPYDLLTPHLDTYPNADIVWAQEEVSYFLCHVGLRLMTSH